MKPDLSFLVDKAKQRATDAYKTLGCRPGPGIDIYIIPTNPISNCWKLEAKTECAKRWLRHLGYAELISNTSLPRMKREACDWGLSFFTDWSCVLEERSDP